MNTLKSVLGIAGILVASQAAAQITFFDREDFRGRSFSTDRPVANLERVGFNDRASSAVVDGGRWQVCEDARFSGQCVVLRPGRYDSLAAMGLNNQISSVRSVRRDAQNESSQPAYAVAEDRGYGPREGERLYEANVTSVHAVVGPPEQRCWTERQNVVTNDRGNPNIGGAVVGAVIGGILGHQIGNGRGNDLATAGGAVGGAALGANIGRGEGDGQTYSQNVRRCAEVPSDAHPDYWDVTYNFRGVEHRVQTSTPPGRTVTVNQDGEPRLQ